MDSVLPRIRGWPVHETSETAIVVVVWCGVVMMRLEEMSLFLLFKVP